MVGDISIGEYNLHIEDIKVEDEDDYECQVTLHLLRSRSAKVMVLGKRTNFAAVGCPKHLVGFLLTLYRLANKIFAEKVCSPISSFSFASY